MHAPTPQVRPTSPVPPAAAARGMFLAMALIALAPVLAAKEAQVRFVAENIPDPAGRVVLAAAEKRSDPFDLPVNHLTEPIDAPARTFQIVTEPGGQVLANVPLPAEGDDFVVLLVTSNRGYTPVVIHANDPAFRRGDIYCHNNSRRTVLGRIGTAAFTLAPNKGSTVRPAGALEGGFYNVALGVREDEGDRILTTMRWPEDDQARVYVFFYNHPETGLVTYRAVTEFIGVE